MKNDEIIDSILKNAEKTDFPLKVYLLTDKLLNHLREYQDEIIRLNARGIVPKIDKMIRELIDIKNGRN
jgi:hypothetical protein